MTNNFLGLERRSVKFYLHTMFKVASFIVTVYLITRIGRHYFSWMVFDPLYVFLSALAYTWILLKEPKDRKPRAL